MIKEMFKKFTAPLIFGILAGCATGQMAPLDHAMNFETAEHPSKVESLWSEKLQGRITDLSVSANGGVVVVATAPDPDLETSEYSLRALTHSGKQLWKTQMQSPVKAQAISADGSLLIISNYNDEILGIDQDGKQLWKSQGMCKPFFLDAAHKIICYHDDDAESRVAFDVLDYNGNKLSSFPANSDVLSFKISQDERNAVIGEVKGQVILLDPEQKLLWQRKVNGEIVDVAVSSGAEPRLAALFNAGKNGQKLAVFDRKGKSMAEKAVGSHVEQIEFSQDGKMVFAYGNGPKGQYLSAMDSTHLNETWHREDARYADYSSAMLVAGESVVIGFEDVAPNTRHSHLLAFNIEGKLIWNIPLVTEEGAYLYGQAFSPATDLLIVGTDDSMLSGYQIGK